MYDIKIFIKLYFNKIKTIKLLWLNYNIYSTVRFRLWDKIEKNGKTCPIFDR